MSRVGFRIPRIFSDLQELLQEYPGTLPRMALFHSESVFFPEIVVGVSRGNTIRGNKTERF